MLKTGPITLIVRALFLALVGFLIVSGTAFAHGGATAAMGNQPPGQVQTAAEQDTHDIQRPAAKALTSQERPEQAGRSGSEPCSDDGPGGHLTGGCCNVACHAALAALAVDPAGSINPITQYIAGLSDMLVGRPNDRAERPPKRR